MPHSTARDAALDRAPGLVVLWVELRWPATAGPALLAAADLVGLVRNGAADTATPQVGVVLAGRVRPVCCHSIEPLDSDFGPKPVCVWASLTDNHDISLPSGRIRSYVHDRAAATP